LSNLASCIPVLTAPSAQAGIIYCPGKAANAGGVAVSGLEMTQNRMVSVWHDFAVC